MVSRANFRLHLKRNVSFHLNNSISHMRVQYLSVHVATIVYSITRMMSPPVSDCFNFFFAAASCWAPFWMTCTKNRYLQRGFELCHFGCIHSTTLIGSCSVTICRKIWITLHCHCNDAMEHHRCCAWKPLRAKQISSLMTTPQSF